MTTVYIIHSMSAQKYYVGMTTRLRRRLKEHQAGQTNSTKGFKDWKLIWSQPLEDSNEARNLENRIKKRGAMRFLKDQAN